MVAPLLLHLAQAVGGNPAADTKTAIWLCFGIAAGGALVAAYVVVLGRARLQKPDLETGSAAKAQQSTHHPWRQEYVESGPWR